MSDPNALDKKLRLLSQNGNNKSQLSFLKYKFNPGDDDENENKITDRITEKPNDKYGQLIMPGK